jgi:hypothetical protein
VPAPTADARGDNTVPFIDLTHTTDCVREQFLAGLEGVVATNAFIRPQVRSVGSGSCKSSAWISTSSYRSSTPSQRLSDSGIALRAHRNSSDGRDVRAVGPAAGRVGG